MVTRLGSPPNFCMWRCTHFSANSWSKSPALRTPLALISGDAAKPKAPICRIPIFLQVRERESTRLRELEKEENKRKGAGSHSVLYRHSNKTVPIGSHQGLHWHPAISKAVAAAVDKDIDGQGSGFGSRPSSLSVSRTCRLARRVYVQVQAVLVA